MRRAFAWLLALATGAGALLFVLSSCNSPFIPIPPPGDPSFMPVTATDAAGATRTAWEVRGTPQSLMADAKVFVYNVDGGTGLIVHAGGDGAYVASPLDAKRGDRVEIHYETPHGQVSPEICRVVDTGVARDDCVKLDGGR